MRVHVGEKHLPVMPSRLFGKREAIEQNFKCAHRDSMPLIERAIRSHSFDFCFAVAEQSRQHLIGMLPKYRRRSFDIAYSLAHPPWDPAVLPLTDLAMLAIN